MDIDDLIKRRKKSGLSRSKMCELIGYSKPWLEQFENKGERRVSKMFLNRYREVLERYEQLKMY